MSCLATWHERRNVASCFLQPCCSTCNGLDKARHVHRNALQTPKNSFLTILYERHLHKQGGLGLLYFTIIILLFSRVLCTYSSYCPFHPRPQFSVWPFSLLMPGFFFVLVMDLGSFLTLALSWEGGRQTGLVFGTTHLIRRETCFFLFVSTRFSTCFFSRHYLDTLFYQTPWRRLFLLPMIIVNI